MVRLDQLEKAMRPNFIWDRTGLKPLQTNEEYEGAKDIARMVFVGLAEMYGFDQVDVMNYLDMEYDSHRNKVQAFRSNYRESMRRVKNESIFLIEDPVKRFYLKTALCLNSIKFATRSNPFIKLEDWLTYE